HFALRQHGAVRRQRFQVEIIPDTLPEPVEVADRPLPELFIVVKVQAAAFLKPTAITHHLRGLGLGHDFSMPESMQPVFAARKIKAARESAGTNASAHDLIAQALITEAQEHEDAEASVVAAREAAAGGQARQFSPTSGRPGRVRAADRLWPRRRLA